MACLDMYSSSPTSGSQNPDHKGLSCTPMSPRISFSNDFVESSDHSSHHHHQQQMMIKPRGDHTPAAPSSDFEFSVTSYSKSKSMMSADELFFKGRLLPFKDTCTTRLQKPTTLREELLADDEDDDEYEFSLRPPKGSTRWKEILGLKKTHIGSKKPAKSDALVDRTAGLIHDQEAQVSKNSKELLNDGGSSCRDVEFGM